MKIFMAHELQLMNVFISGRDKLGNLYWYQVDHEATLRVYKDDPEEETWEVVAQNREELVTLLNSLKSGPTFVRENSVKESENSPMEEEEEESMQGYENVIRDTGPVPESNATSVNCSDDESSVTSRLKVSAASSKGTSREVSPSRSIDSASKIKVEENSKNTPAKSDAKVDVKDESENEEKMEVDESDIKEEKDEVKKDDNWRRGVAGQRFEPMLQIAFAAGT